MIAPYISNQSTKEWQGPYHNISKQVNFQKEVDKVLWFNVNHETCEKWLDTGYYSNLTDIPSGRMESLFSTA